MSPARAARRGSTRMSLVDRSSGGARRAQPAARDDRLDRAVKDAVHDVPGVTLDHPLSGTPAELARFIRVRQGVLDLLLERRCIVVWNDVPASLEDLRDV